MDGFDPIASPTPTPSQTSSYEVNGYRMDVFDELASSQPVSSSTDDGNINIMKKDNYKEGRKEEGGYGNGYSDVLDYGSSSNEDDDTNKEDGAMNAPK